MEKPKAKPNLLIWLAVAGLTWGAGYIYNVYLGGEPRWLKSMYETKVALAETMDVPKLIVTGGSGAHYTINSEILAEALGRPVVNLGIDGPVGLNVILPAVLDSVEPGDVVLLIPEYLVLHHENGLGERSGSFSITTGQLGSGGIPPRQLAQDWLMLGIPSLRGVVKSATDLVNEGRLTGYYDDPLTENGDPTIDKVRTGEWWQMTIREPATPYALKRIEQFREEVEARGATLVLSLPWVYAKDDERTVDNIQKTAEALSEIAPTIYDAETLNIKTVPDLFADTHYHLSAEGRAVRSRQLATELQPLLNP